MGKTKQVRIDPELDKVFKQLKKQGKVKTFPEFSRLVASDFFKTKKSEFKFFK